MTHPALEHYQASERCLGRATVARDLPYDSALKYLIFDRAANFNAEVISIIKSFGIEPKRTSFRSPWQNGVAERFVSSCRLGVSQSSVKATLQQLFEKTGVRTRSQLVRFAIERSLETEKR
jgi:hypothetical protein